MGCETQKILDAGMYSLVVIFCPEDLFAMTDSCTLHSGVKMKPFLVGNNGVGIGYAGRVRGRYMNGIVTLLLEKCEHKIKQ